MGTSRVLQFLFVRVLTPAILVACLYVKQNFLTSVYWLFIFSSPFVAYTSKSSTKHGKSIYSILLFIVSLLNLLLVGGFQLLPNQNRRPPGPLNGAFRDSITYEKLAETVGFINLMQLNGNLNRSIYLLPDIVSFVWATIHIVNGGMYLPVDKPFTVDYKGLQMRKFIVLPILGLTGAMFPCWIEFMYYVIFILFVTRMSFGFSIDRCFVRFCRVLAVFVMAHCLFIFFHQMEWMQTAVPIETRTARMFGLKSWKSLKMDKFGLNFSKFECHSHLQLPMLALLYQLLACQGKTTFRSDNTSGSPRIETGRNNFLSSLREIFFPRPDYYLKTMYLATNAVMMVWSALYRHWLSLIFLLCVSLMWVFNKRRVMDIFSRCLVFYAICLLIIQYVYCMDFTESELPPDAHEIGLNKQRGDSGPIIIKSLLTIVFWINLYVCISVKWTSQDEIDYKLPFLKTREFINNILAQIWFTVTILLLFLSGLLGNHMQLTRILFTGFALLFCFLIQIHLRESLSMKIRYTLCATLIICSMLMLTLIYTYQFVAIAQFWDFLIPEKIKHLLSIESLKADILINFSKLILVVIIVSIYVNVFHKAAVPSPTSLNIWRTLGDTTSINGSLTSLENWDESSFLYKLHSSLSFVAQYLKIHKLDLIWLTMGLCILHSQAGFTRLFCLVLAVLGLCLPARGQIFVIRFISFLLSAFTLLFVLYQLPALPTAYTGTINNLDEKQKISVTKSMNFLGHTVEDILNFIGVYKTEDVLSELIGYVLIISIITSCEDLNDIQYPYSLFSKITYFATDDTILSSLKYILNYGFYRFSLEVCFISMLASIVNRPGFMSLIMLLWLTTFICLTRSQVNRIWKVFMAYQIIMIPWQYFVVLSSSTFLTPYSKYVLTFVEMNAGVRLNFQEPCNLIFYDFMVLFISVKHLRTVQLESQLVKENKVFAGGSNSPLPDSVSTDENPTRNFYQNMHSSLDIIKSYLFGTSFWVTLTFVFAIYNRQPYIFSLGFIISVFLLLWLGKEFFLKSQKQILRYINLLISYTICVLLMKMVFLVIVTHSETMVFHEWCNYIGFFIPIVFNPESNSSMINGLRCYFDREHFELFWDAVCLVVFIFQKRIFRSYFFLHVVSEIKYNVIDASREFKKKSEMELENYKTHQERNLKIYKELSEKIKRENSKSPRTRPPQHHFEAVRSGDYYMFPSIKINIQDNNEELSTHQKNEDKHRRQSADTSQDSGNRLVGIMNYLILFIQSGLLIIISWLNDKSRNYTSTREAFQKHKETRFKDLSKTDQGEKEAEQNFLNITFAENENMFRTEEIEKLSEKQDTNMSKETNLILQLYFSVYYATVSNTTIITYTVIILHQAITASLLTLPISIMLFLWGSLTVPRPKVTFWIWLIIYVEIMISFKFIFSFNTIKWNNMDTKEVFSPPMFIGVWKGETVSVTDFFLLLALFHHRHVLKSWGLWVRRPSPELFLTELKEKFVILENTNIWESCCQCFKEYLQPPIKFLVALFKEKRTNIKKDVYIYLFLCDFFIFVILFAKFDSFAPPDQATDVSEFFRPQHSSKFTITYVLCLITQFCLILIDRVLYLRRFLKGKIVFDIVEIVAFHLLIFFVHPIYTNRYFKESLFPQLIYIFKSSYFAISSYIIRYGYPTTMVENIFKQDAGLINKYLYFAYYNIPFLHELRTIMDWMWTDTSLTLTEWFQFEEIHRRLYLIRCDAKYEEHYPSPRGKKYPLKMKYGLGLLIILLIFVSIWGPILLFTDYGVEQEIVPDLPVETRVNIRVGSHSPFYSQTIHKTQLVPISDDTYKQLKQLYPNSTKAENPFKAFNHNLVFAAPLSPESLWNLSPRQADKLERELNCEDTKGTRPLLDSHSCELQNMTLTIEMTKEETTVTDQHSITLPKEIKAKLKELLFGGAQDNAILIDDFFPKFIKSTPENVFLAELMRMSANDSMGKKFFDMTMKISFIPTGSSLKTANKIWTTVETDVSNMPQEFKNIPLLTSVDPVYIFIFNQESMESGGGIINSIVSMIRTKGILWIYSSYVVVISLRVMRNLLQQKVETIYFEYLPYVDRLWEMCGRIYIAREMKDLILEEDLYARLIFLFRSTETLVMMARQPRQSNTV